MQTEVVELGSYAIFGLLLACTPLLMKLSLSFDKTTGRGNLQENPRFELFRSYGFYLSFPLAAVVFSSLVYFWCDPIKLMGVSDVHTGITFLKIIGLSTGVTGVAMLVFSKPCEKKQESNTILSLIVLLFLMVALAFNLSTSFFEPSSVNLDVFFHHWGAYLSAAKSLDAGLAIFKDFPTQYGLGPTLLIAFASHLFGWVSGMFYVVGSLQFLYWISITAIAFKLIENSEGRKYFLWFLILLITTSSCFFWFPAVSLYTNQAPSLGGARYFPVTFFVAILLSLDLTSQKLTTKKVWVMHTAWALCALWSIESVFYVCLVWWPLYIYVKLSANISLRSKFHSVFHSVMELLLVAAALVFAFIAIYLLIYKTLPELTVFTVFVQNIPGAMLINFEGPFIFIVSVLLMSLSTLIYMFKKHGNSNEFHYLFVITLMAYAASSYYIGRSHDYNIRPLIPFYSLILLSMCPVLFPQFVRFFSISLLSLLVCWVGINQYNLGFSRFDLFDFNGKDLNAKFQKYRENPQTSDLGRAIDYISKNHNESVVALDPVSSITLSGNQDQWNAYNNMASYNYLPNRMQKKFIERSKRKLMKSGWVLVHKDMGIFGEPFVLDLFNNSYSLDESIMFGVYKAFRFVPKPN